MSKARKQTQDETWGIRELLDDFHRMKVDASSSYSTTPFIDRSSTPRCMKDSEHPQWFSHQATHVEFPSAYEAGHGVEYDDGAHFEYDSYDEPLDTSYHSGGQQAPSASVGSSYSPSVDTMLSSTSSCQPSVFSVAGVSVSTHCTTPPLRGPRQTMEEWLQTAPIPEPPAAEGPHYSCEFCDAPFAESAQWVHHVATQHLQNRYPPKAECVFCDSFFESTSKSDRKSNFLRRMTHIQGHIDDGWYGDEGRNFKRPDWSLYGYLNREGILADTDAARLMKDFVPKPKGLVPRKSSSRTQGAKKHREVEVWVVEKEDKRRKKDDKESRSRRKHDYY